MKKHILTYTIIALCIAVGAGCGGNSAEESAQQAAQKAEQLAKNLSSGGDSAEAAKNMEHAVKEMTKAMGHAANVEPVDFRKLKQLLPDEAAGIKRTNAKGQKSGVMGMKLSSAEGRYRDGDKNVTLTITDLGTLKGMAMMGYAAWLNMELDQESDTGYERTTKYEGYPAYEKFERDPSPRGELSVLVGQRFLVNIKCRNLEMDDVKDVLGEISLAELDAMKSVGVK